LDITQRRNHSFAVSYYNDENGLPGTDATIYDPAPDFRFINDTPGHILIQTFVGTDGILTYEFWGTNDGRGASTTVPVILSRSPAPDTKYIETEDLAPGVTECTGSNVPGYKTTFKYSTVTAAGEYQEEYFDSSYRPWQRVCLIGVVQVSEQPVEEL
jgi:vancomycin resistance protein YoaR